MCGSFLGSAFLGTALFARGLLRRPPPEHLLHRRRINNPLFGRKAQHRDQAVAGGALCYWGDSVEAVATREDLHGSTVGAWVQVRFVFELNVGAKVRCADRMPLAIPVTFQAQKERWRSVGVPLPHSRREVRTQNDLE